MKSGITCVSTLAITASMAVIALVLGACGNDAMRTETSANGAVAALIAEIEGCNLYRVSDRHIVYVAICPDGRAATQHQESCGKSCTRPAQGLTAIRP